ncbi:MAG: hypothetical protein KDA87_16685 [Planctomycetales bacterium]|nr:hypothetical protein [Planctomycetales bacterium]
MLWSRLGCNRWSKTDAIRHELNTLRNRACLASPYRTLSAAVRSRSIEPAALSVKEGTSLLALGLAALHRGCKIECYDTQLQAASAMLNGFIVEMATGEGKTYAAALAAIALATFQRGVHLVTANEYLATRDYLLLRPAFEEVGLACAVLYHGQSTPDRRAAYQADVTFGAASEFGFDFLRDQALRHRSSRKRLGSQFLDRFAGTSEYDEPLQRHPFCAIVDEVDSVLLDEASIPLILADTPVATSSADRTYRIANQVAQQLDGNAINLSPTTGEVTFSDHAWRLMHQVLISQRDLSLLRPWSQYVATAVRAERWYQRDVHYTVQDGQIQLVDQQTGRIHGERTWKWGLQQAIQAKEGVTITPETITAGSITRQRYFQRYSYLCGLTGTAWDARQEFREVYHLGIHRIPEHRLCQRVALPERYFEKEVDKFQAIAIDVQARQRQGQPVLIGTRTIRSSFTLSCVLAQHNIGHQTLNGVQDEDEANLIHMAGQAGTVTIATNMAGRGTDIRLDEVSLGRGGLHVIVAERHESVRVDRQLIGRSARQGQRGSYQTFVSADDDFLATSPKLQAAIRRAALNHQHNSLTRSLAVHQRRLEIAAAYRRSKLHAQDNWTASVRRSLVSCSPT